jgi:hypothetical protein
MSAVSLRHETLEAVQNRLFGAAYMNSIRQIRNEVGEDETIYLVDAQARHQGAPFFLLNWLAPRRVIYVGSLREDTVDSLQHRLPRSARWVVTVGEGQAPPILEKATEFDGP